jgi:hypothetical protein
MLEYGMAFNFLRCDRDQPFLLPPDLRDWLPQRHLAWFILDVTDQLDLQPFYRAHRADGHGAVPPMTPKTLLGVLLDARCIGVRSSRQLERRCADALIGAGLPEWWGARHPERMGNTPTSPFALPPDRQGRLQGQRRPPPPPQPAGQAPWLCRPARVPAGPAGGRLERPPSSPPTSIPPRRPSAAPSPITRSVSHPAASNWAASASAPPSSAPPLGSPSLAWRVFGPWWTGWLCGRGRWRS